jgi:hypothetical protein
MEIGIDDHHKKRKISSEECVPKWTPEEATLPLRTNLTTLPTTSAELYATFFRTPPDHVTPFFNHHIKAVIRDGTLVLPGTPPGTNSRRTQSSTVTSPTAPPQPTELVRRVCARAPTACTCFRHTRCKGYNRPAFELQFVVEQFDMQMP